MKETRIFEYYAFGYNYNILRNYDAQEPVHGDDDSLIARLKRHFQFLDELDLRVTSKACRKATALLYDLEEMPRDAKVTEALRDRVRAAMDEQDATLDAELELAKAFIVTPKRFAAHTLLEAPREFLAPHVFDALPPLAQYDFAEGCTCIAFARPTAAAFHLMRCVEGALRAYYCGIVQRGRVRKLMWFDMVAHLARRRDAPPKPVLDNLNNIRENFRNPTQHPDGKYDIEEAQDLLAVTIDALNRMYRDQVARLL